MYQRICLCREINSMICNIMAEPKLDLEEYAMMARFDSFYSKFLEYLNQYEFPYEKMSDIYDVSTDYTEYRHAQIILCRSGQNIRVHFMVAHINN